MTNGWGDGARPEPGGAQSGTTTDDPVASVVVVATDERHHLRDCLPSLLAMDGPPTEVIVIDNASGDGSGAWIASAFPTVRVVRSEERLGYAPANNLGFRHARGRYLVVLNPDTRVDPGFVRGLVATSQQAGDRALVTSRVCLFDRPDTINTCGNDVQFAMLASCRGLGDPAASHAASTEVASVSGCAFLIPRPLLEQIGPFATAIYPYLEDTELSVRARLAGFACLTAPESVVYHKYAIRLTPRKFFHIERNRWLVMLRSYRIGTLLLLAPALAAVEAMAWAYAATRGRDYLGAKARSWLAVLGQTPAVVRGRREVAAKRRVGDRALLAAFGPPLPVGQLVAGRGAGASALVGLASACLAGYVRLVRAVVRW